MELSQLQQQAITKRKATHEIAPWILGRWSPRAMSGEALTDVELLPLFEAARWAPSSFNGQPWRFLYAKRDTPEWNIFYNLLGDWNKAWTAKASVLILAVGRKNFEHNEKPSRTHGFDTGAAWENLALEGAQRGLVVHGMEGFDYDRARTELHVPDAFEIFAMIAVGKPGEKDDLPDNLREIEEPSNRRPLAEMVKEGIFWNS